MTVALALKLRTDEQKVTRTVMDTIMVGPADTRKWKAPPFQRPVKENAKIIALADQMRRDSGVWPGVVTLGVLKGDTYIIDGQHRRAAFLISGLEEGYADVRIHYMDSMAEMGDEFVNLNSQLVRMGPDDILRGLEPSIPALKMIRDRCPFVGYDSVRRGPNTPMLSMSVALRCWTGSLPEVPKASSGSARSCAESLDIETAQEMCEFLRIAHNSFGRDPEYYRMWGALNLTLCMWTYRRVVLEKNQLKRATHFTKELFQKCLMALTADPVYVDWLQGRSMGERDRSPAYNRLKNIFIKRASMETAQKVKLPKAAWVSN